VNRSELVQALKRAASNRRLIARISPLIAYSFGVIPFKESARGVCLACYQGINPDCMAFLRRHLAKEVLPFGCDDELMDRYLERLYPSNGDVNMNTFESPDFTKDPKNAPMLMQDKVDDLGTVRSDLKIDELVVLDISSYSRLQNLDHPVVQENLAIGDMEIPFREEGGEVVVWGSPVEESVLVMGRRDYFFDGYEQLHGIMSHRAAALPLVIHPSEVQITRIHSDGGLTFYLYDRLEEVKPGEAFEWRKKYYFLQRGNRFCRELAIKVRKTKKVKRRELKYSLGPLEWTAEDLTRWFRLDCPHAYPNLAETGGASGAG